MSSPPDEDTGKKTCPCHPRFWLLLAILALAGCAGPAVPPHVAAELAGLPYPQGEGAPYGDDLDIVVRKRGDELELTNREPRSFHHVQLWLNQQYVRHIPLIRVGADPDLNTFPLRTFINEHREPYPVGGLLTPDKSFPVVLAELYDPATGRKHRLLTRWKHR